MQDDIEHTEKFVYVVHKDGTGEEFELDRNPNYGVNEDWIDTIRYILVPVQCDKCKWSDTFDVDHEIDEVDSSRQMGNDTFGHAGSEYSCIRCKSSMDIEVRTNQYANGGSVFESDLQGCHIYPNYHSWRRHMRQTTP